MFTVLICMVVMTVLALREVFKMVDSIFDGILMTVLSGFIGIFIGGIVGGILAIVVGLAVPNTPQTQTATSQLVSLRNDDGIEGRFFLGTGSIGTEQYYFFYEEVDNGFRPGKIRIDGNVLVREEERSDAQVVATWTAYPRRAIDNFVIDWRQMTVGSNPSYVFHVPQGSIQRNYVLN